MTLECSVPSSSSSFLLLFSSLLYHYNLQKSNVAKNQPRPRSITSSTSPPPLFPFFLIFLPSALPHRARTRSSLVPLQISPLPCSSWPVAGCTQWTRCNTIPVCPSRTLLAAAPRFPESGCCRMRSQRRSHDPCGPWPMVVEGTFADTLSSHLPQHSIYFVLVADFSALGLPVIGNPRAIHCRTTLHPNERGIRHRIFQVIRRPEEDHAR